MASMLPEIKTTSNFSLFGRQGNTMKVTVFFYFDELSLNLSKEVYING